MGNFQDTFEIRKRSFTRVFSICMTVPLRQVWAQYKDKITDVSDSHRNIEISCNSKLKLPNLITKFGYQNYRQTTKI